MSPITNDPLDAELKQISVNFSSPIQRILAETDFRKSDKKRIPFEQTQASNYKSQSSMSQNIDRKLDFSKKLLALKAKGIFKKNMMDI